MSRHPAPERWADLFAGRVPEPERAALEAHAAACEPCAGARRRVEAARAAMTTIADAPALPLNWDTLGARIHWSVSSDLRRRERERERRRAWSRRLVPFALGGAGLVGAAAAVLVWVRPAPVEAPAPAAAPGGQGEEAPPHQALEPDPPEVVAAAPLEGVVTLAQGGATIDGAPASLDAVLRPGSRLVTGDGRLAVQFGDRSGFVIEPYSTVVLSTFDARAVELAVTGAVVVEVTRLSDDQRFAVVSGARAVEVRGTAFRVADDGSAFDVTVSRGRVAVMDAEASVEVPAGARLALGAGAPVAGARPRPISPADLDAVTARLRVPLLPAWTDPPAARRSSAVLSISAGPRAPIVIDGVRVATGAVAVRTAPGRYLVEVGGRKKWVEVEAGARGEPAFDTPRTSLRAGEFRAQMQAHWPRFETCVRPLRSVDPQFNDVMRVAVEIGADGTLRSVHATKGLADRRTEECVLGVIRDHFTFKPGAAETVRQIMQF